MSATFGSSPLPPATISNIRHVFSSVTEKTCEHMHIRLDPTWMFSVFSKNSALFKDFQAILETDIKYAEKS